MPKKDTRIFEQALAELEAIVQKLERGEAGLDEYEVRHWHSWHRHITLSMMAHAWLASVCCKAEKKRGLRTQAWLN